MRSDTLANLTNAELRLVQSFLDDEMPRSAELEVEALLASSVDAEDALESLEQVDDLLRSVWFLRDEHVVEDRDTALRRLARDAAQAVVRALRRLRATGRPPAETGLHTSMLPPTSAPLFERAAVPQQRREPSPTEEPDPTSERDRSLFEWARDTLRRQDSRRRSARSDEYQRLQRASRTRGGFVRDRGTQRRLRRALRSLNLAQAEIDRSDVLREHVASANEDLRTVAAVLAPDARPGASPRDAFLLELDRLTPDAAAEVHDELVAQIQSLEAGLREAT